MSQSFKYILFLCFFIGFSHSTTYSQDIIIEYENRGLTVGAYLTFSSFLNNESVHRDTDMNGFGIELNHKYNSKISLLTRIDLNFGGNDPESIAYITIGPSYTIHLNDKNRLSPFVGGGVSFSLGNDYLLASGAFNAGLKYDFDLTEKNSLFLGAALKQASSFHPGHIEFLEIFVGLTF